MPMVLIGTCLLTLIAAGAKIVKEAQSYMSMPDAAADGADHRADGEPGEEPAVEFAVPFLAQNQMILKLVRSEAISGLEWAVYLGAGFGVGLVLWWLAARRYHHEQLAISA